MNTSDFNYDLPSELIAQHPVEPRDAARLLIAALGTHAAPAHRQVRDLVDCLQPGDLLVRNTTRVIPARLAARKDSGGAVEVLLVHAHDGQPQLWECLVGGKVRVGTRLSIGDTQAEVVACHEDGHRTLRFAADCHVLRLADAHGHIPLPPYIKRSDNAADRERYQTIFADRPGSVAAPTAGLHFTNELCARLAAKGVLTADVTLAIGPGTFKPVNAERIEDFQIHREHGECPQATVDAVRACKARGNRVIAIGTTSVRVLESAARQPGGFAAWSGWTRLFLHPPQTMQIVDGLLTNFHLPQSSLLMLVACMTGVDRLHALYAEAIRERYRFYSYGDAMLLLP